ncbi:MAG TPA: F0F1 ATP synthase subunit delta [Casimicrobiaceae bacterium]|nr:F0F1 ATP synthase subunit delta [Casimicrobiaceae bacterium]
MAELATIARPYAEAAFRLAREDNALASWGEMLRFLATIVRNPRVAEALDNPKLDAPEKESLLLSVAGDRVTGLGRNFVRVLVEADRVMLLTEIARLFDELKADAEGIAQATIQTAFPLDDAQVREITSSLERRFGKKIEASVEIDKSLIGGVRIAVGDTVIDGSVKAKLDAMHVQLRA